jgi:adenosine deaminase
MLAELARRGVECPLDPHALDGIVPVRSSSEWLEVYAPRVAPCMVSLAQIIAILEVHIERLIAQSVEYCELMLSGLLGSTDVIETFRSIREAIDRAQRGAIEVHLLVAVARRSPERLERQVDRILEVARAGLICGVAIAGDEAACSIESLASHCARIKDAGLGLEIHAGETRGPESVWDALEHGRPDRIGHGVRAFEDARLLDLLIERRVHLELCPTSNLRLGVVKDIRQHPIVRARELGMSFSINTDDPGPFGCSMRSEEAMLRTELGFSDGDFARILRDSREARFAVRSAST